MTRLLSLCTLITLVAGCGGSGSTDPDPVTAHGDYHRFVMKRLILPKERKEFAIDLNGDGNVDNQLGQILAVALAAQQNLDIQTGVDQAVEAGDALCLLALQTADPSLRDDTQVGATFAQAVNLPSPDLSGAATTPFTLDAALPPGTFYGKLQAGRFRSSNPVTTKNPVTLEARVPLFPNTDPIPLVVHGAHLQLSASSSGLCAEGDDAQDAPCAIQGSLKIADVNTTILPAVAKMLTAELATDQGPMIKALFDHGDNNGGQCVNLDGTFGIPNDSIIAPCEIQNSIIQNVIAPDIQIYDAQGNYAPTSAKGHEDSFSIAFGFSAVGAQFNYP